MTKLYPIGTQLITRRLSQAALAHELGCSIETQSASGKFYPGFDFGINDNFNIPFSIQFDTWRVTVTEENQKWLSPVPMVGDWVETFDNMIQILEGSGDDVGFERKGIIYFWENEPIVLRTYPNGQRAPMIEWDEVIEPEHGEQL